MVEDDWVAAEKLLRTWERRTREGQHSHHNTGKAYRRTHYVIAIPTIIVTTILGTAAFASISSNSSTGFKVLIGILGMLAAASGAAQLNLRLPERSEKHKYLGAQYGNIRRRIEAILATPRKERDKPGLVLESLQKDLDRISNEGEAVSERRFKSTVRELRAWDEERGKKRD